MVKIRRPISIGFTLLTVLFFTGEIAYSAQSSELKPEKNPLEVAIAATGPLYLPVLLANEAGYFSKRGLTVNISTLSATASAQALLSGQVDIYQGGTATIHANVGGADLIYIAASVDRSTLMLFGQKGLTSFENLRGKSVATTSVGAFGEIAMRKPPKSMVWKSAKTSSFSTIRDRRMRFRLFSWATPKALSSLRRKPRWLAAKAFR